MASTKGGRGVAPMAPAAVIRPQALGPIQVIPPGLMGFLQLKQTGQLPDALSKTVAPVLELRDWYLQARRVDLLSLFGVDPTSAVKATGTRGIVLFDSTGTNLTKVPPGQYWYVWHASIDTLTAAAGDTCRYCVALLGANGSTIQQAGPDFTDTVNAQIRNMTAEAQAPFWLGPGESVAANVLYLTSVGMTFSCRMRFTVLPI